jgi:hypothetical protein
MGKAPTTVRKPVYRSNTHTPNFSSRYLFFYYLTHTHPDVRAYFITNQQPLSPAQAEVEIKRIAEEIKRGTYPHQPSGFRLGHFTWRYKSYFAVVLQDDTQKLIKNDAVEFQLLPRHRPDHNFRDGKDIPIWDGNLTGFLCINHMRHEHGHVLRQGEYESFWIETHHNATGERSIAPVFPAHDDSGTNVGPPNP